MSGVPRAVLCLALSLAACGTPPPPPEPTVFFPEPPNPPRVQFLRSVSTVTDVAPPRTGLDELLFGARRDEGEIQRPFGCAVHDGVVYVTDSRFGQILAIDFAKSTMDVLEIEGRGAPKKPTSICFLPDGRMLYTDAGRRQVVILDKDHRYAGELGPWGDECRPVDVACWRDRLFVVDAGGHCVRVLDLVTGEEIRTLGAVESQDERLRGPASIAVDERGYCYVSDSIYGRVYVWDKDGFFVRHIGEPGDVVGQFARPKGLAVLDRTLWVLDSAFENCQVFALNGEPVMFFGGHGTGPGQLYMPAAIWVGRDGLDLFKDRIDKDFVAEQLVVVTSQYGPRKLSFYAFGRSKKFKYEDVELPPEPMRPTAPPVPADTSAQKEKKE